MLRGKSPCRRAESASGRPQGSGQGAGGEATGGAATSGWGRLQQHSYVVSALFESAN